MIVRRLFQVALSCTVLAFSALPAHAEEHAVRDEKSAAPVEAHPAGETANHAKESEQADQAGGNGTAATPETHTPKIEAQSAPPPSDPALEREAQSLLKLGGSLAERGDFAASEIAYWQILRNRAYARPEQREALLGLARMHRKQAAFTKAAAVYEKFLKLYSDDPRVPDALLELGRCQRAMGAYKNAINRFYNVINSTLKLPPESYDHYQLLAKTAQFEIAETYLETGNFTEAAKFFDRLRLLDLAPEDRARAHFKSAYALLSGGDTDKAVIKFTQFIEQWPEDSNVPEARYLLALTLRQLGRTDEALSMTLTLLRAQQGNAGTDPKTWAYWQRRTGNQLANDFFQAGDTLSAVAIYEGLARLSNALTWRMPIVYQTGLCYERLRQTSRATEAYQEIVAAALQAKGTDAPSLELAELGKMAQWRISQLDWANSTDSHLTRFFSTSVPQSTPAAPLPAAQHDDTPPSAAATPGAL